MQNTGTPAIHGGEDVRFFRSSARANVMAAVVASAGRTQPAVGALTGLTRSRISRSNRATPVPSTADVTRAAL